MIHSPRSLHLAATNSSAHDPLYTRRHFFSSPICLPRTHNHRSSRLAHAPGRLVLRSTRVRTTRSCSLFTVSSSVLVVEGSRSTPGLSYFFWIYPIESVLHARAIDVQRIGVDRLVLFMTAFRRITFAERFGPLVVRLFYCVCDSWLLAHVERVLLLFNSLPALASFIGSFFLSVFSSPMIIAFA